MNMPESNRNDVASSFQNSRPRFLSPHQFAMREMSPPDKNAWTDALRKEVAESVTLASIGMSACTPLARPQAQPAPQRRGQHAKMVSNPLGEPVEIRRVLLQLATLGSWLLV